MVLPAGISRVSSASLFTDLDLLEIGDHFLIKVLDETLCYEVDQILTVEPDETEALQVEEGEDLVTLLTCTPYGVNTQRLLVRGHRVPYEETVAAEEEAPLAAVSLHTNYLLWAVIGLAVTGTAVTLLVLRDRKRRRRAAENSSAPDAPDPPEERQDGEGK